MTTPFCLYLSLFDLFKLADLLHMLSFLLFSLVLTFEVLKDLVKELSVILLISLDHLPFTLLCICILPLNL